MKKVIKIVLEWAGEWATGTHLGVSWYFLNRPAADKPCIGFFLFGREFSFRLEA